MNGTVYEFRKAEKGTRPRRWMWSPSDEESTVRSGIDEMVAKRPTCSAVYPPSMPMSDETEDLNTPTPLWPPDTVARWRRARRRPASAKRQDGAAALEPVGRVPTTSLTDARARQRCAVDSAEQRERWDHVQMYSAELELDSVRESC